MNMFESHTTSYLIYAATVGMFRGIISLIIEHPFDALKTYWQANLHIKTTKEAIQKIYKLKGWRGFYSGAIPNAIRLMTKQAYRYPLMLVLPFFFSQFFNSLAIISALSGVMIAVLEVWIIAPLERLKVWLITFNHVNGGLSAFFQQARAEKLDVDLDKKHKNNSSLSSFFSFLFRGSKITIMRQIVSWVTFLVVHEQTIFFFKITLDMREITFSSLLAISAIEALINTVAILPFDEIKTRMQSVGNKNTILGEMQYIYNTRGIKGFYLAYHIRLAQYMIQACFTVTILEKLKAGF